MKDNEKTVVCFGDSNTHGVPPLKRLGDMGRFDRNTRWPGVMANVLGENYHVVEAGHSGRTTSHTDEVEGEHKNGLAVLQTILETHMPVDYLIIMLGTNDLKARFGVSAFEISLSIQRLIKKAQTAEVGPGFGKPKILVISPPPIFERNFLAGMFKGGRQKSLGLAEHYQFMAEMMGVDFLDAGEIIDSDTIDGIHFIAESHKRLGEAIALKIKTMA